MRLTIPTSIFKGGEQGDRDEGDQNNGPTRVRGLAEEVRS